MPKKQIYSRYRMEEKKHHHFSSIMHFDAVKNNDKLFFGIPKSGPIIFLFNPFSIISAVWKFACVRTVVIYTTKQLLQKNKFVKQIITPL